MITQGLDNVIVGGPNHNQVSLRFEAKYELILSTIRTYWIFANHDTTPLPGYARGWRGQYEVSLCPDLNGSPGLPLDFASRVADPLYQEQAGTTTPTGWEPVGAFPLHAFSNRTILTAGKYYHVVFKNVDPDPEHNYASLDFLWDPTVQNQAPDMQVLVGGAGVWQPQPNLIPSPVALFYADGNCQGYAGYELVNGQILNANNYGFPPALNV